MSTESDASHRMAELLDGSDATASTSSAARDDSSPSLRPGALESALAAAEDETDVVAARHAMAEAEADLAEFDENIPLNDDATVDTDAGASKVDQEINKLMGQVSARVKQLTL